MNVLISSAAAKIQLVEHFQEVVHPLGGKVLVADMDPSCCARYFADGFVQLPADDDPAFTDTLLAACGQHGIRLIVPTRDGELAKLAACAEALAALGVVLPLPAAAGLRVCQDKAAFHAFCLERGFPVLPAADPDQDDSFPLFARARTGAGSRAAFRVEDKAQFSCLGLVPEDYVFQPYRRMPEYSCDVLLDFEGKALQAVVRERQKLVRGESWQSRIVDLPEGAALAMQVCEALGLKGHNLVQFFWAPGEGPFLIEVNPRFGGCSSLSIKGGLRSPERMVQLLTGQEAAARQAGEIFVGLTSIRYTRDIFIEEVGRT